MFYIGLTRHCTKTRKHFKVFDDFFMPDTARFIGQRLGVYS
jgi:hypothetical protein